jgi:two-component system, OmpR family, sensor histidine kinase BaeS
MTADRQPESPHNFPRFRRPSWWPENEPWPPARPTRRKRFLRGIGCLFALLGMLFLGGMAILSVYLLGLFHYVIARDQLIIFLVLGFFIFALFAFVVGRIGMRRLVNPVNDLLQAAESIGQGNYAVHVAVRGPREVRTLARTFNEMASRLHNIDEQRRRLLADVTHELHNPLTVIQGNLEGMLDGVYPAGEAELRSLLDETRILSRLVEDLRTLALAESGVLQLKMEATDLALLVKETAATFQPQAEAAGVTLTVETAPNLPLPNLDPGRIRQVLTNLLSNALRYTPAGGTVVIRLRRGRLQKEGDQLLLDVQNSGAGIPADELPHVFERFYKSTDSGGMGLGLAIARHLVEAHGGTIRADSAPGEGTTMRVTLPIEVSDLQQ